MTFLGGSTARQCRRVLAVDDRPSVLGVVAGVLEAAGFDVIEASSMPQRISGGNMDFPDAIVLARHLLVADKEHFCSLFRDAPYIPLVVIGGAGQDSVFEILEIFELGADAYVVVPPNEMELVARIRSLLARKGVGWGDSSDGSPTSYEEIVGSGDERHHITGIRSLLLRRLAQDEGHIVTYRDLIQDVWDDRGIGLQTLRSHMHGLRRELAACSGYRIQTCRGFGYRLLKPQRTGVPEPGKRR